MNLKQVDWKYILLSSLAITFVMIIYMFFTNQFSWWTTLISIIIFPLLGIIISFSKPKSENTKGCLYGKTEDEKHSYFESLYKMIDEDLIFYNEQLTDLLEDELEQFNVWIFEKKYTPVKYKKLTLIKTFEVIKPTNDMETKGEIFKRTQQY